MEKASGIAFGQAARGAMAFKITDNATQAITARIVTTLVVHHSPETGSAEELSSGRAAIRTLW